MLRTLFLVVTGPFPAGYQYTWKSSATPGPRTPPSGSRRGVTVACVRGCYSATSTTAMPPLGWGCPLSTASQPLLTSSTASTQGFPKPNASQTIPN